MNARTVAQASPYQQYVYAYPHKTAYRPLNPRPSLGELWADEAQDTLSLYMHIPFCEVRCGFCNLFTRVGAPEDLTSRYLDALARQASATRDALGPSARTVTAAFGGGTPTFLTTAELTRLFDIAESVTGCNLREVPLSVEASPSTATPDRLEVLAERGTTRVSLGVQTFDAEEARAAVRPQRRSDVHAALGALRATTIPVLNVDLIYGIDGQSEQSFLSSIDAALQWRPEELYLYPLYVRPLTGLARRARLADAEWDAHRLRLYRAGRDRLLESGYRQSSMRMFRRADAPELGPDDYACQTDGMIGLGCGARSYTRDMHYSFDYAVDATQVRAIIDDFVERSIDQFRYAECGIVMTDDERRRRHLLQSVLQAQGMPIEDYLQRFGVRPQQHFGSVLDRWCDRGWLEADDALLRLTDEGLAHSDALGPEVFSPDVAVAMSAYERR